MQDSLLQAREQRYVLAACGVALLTLQQATRPVGLAFSALVLGLGGLAAWWLLSQALDRKVDDPQGPSGGQQDERDALADFRAAAVAGPGVVPGGPRGTTRSGGEYTSDPGVRTLDPMYTLRVLAPEAPLPHTEVRPRVVEALGALRRHTAWGDRGAMFRAAACLEDFFARADAALLSPSGDLARRALPVLLDTRAEALNCLATLAFEPGPRSQGPRRLARLREVVRGETSLALTTLANKHGGAMRGLAHAPPYPWDPAGRDERYHQHY
jgi:hypothetical protein